MVTPSATPLAARARTRSSTRWIFTAARTGEASSARASIRSTRRRMRSVSSTINWASGASRAPRPDLSNWAAPRMPARGFLISWASIRPSPSTDCRPSAARSAAGEAARTLRVSRMALPPNGVAEPSATKGGRPNTSTVNARSRTTPVSSEQRPSKATSGEAGGRAVCKGPRDKRASPWPNRLSAASLAARRAPSASRMRAGSGPYSKARSLCASRRGAARAKATCAIRRPA